MVRDLFNGIIFESLMTMNAATQTEESPISARAHALCRTVVQELALNNPAEPKDRDGVFRSIIHNVGQILERHEILFNGMIQRIDVSEYVGFAFVADELFEANLYHTELNITWGRILSLFAFAVRLARKYKESDEEDEIDNVMDFLSHYVATHLLDFVQSNGGWDDLVSHFPPPDNGEAQRQATMLFSALCVGVVGWMYMTSLTK